jgi:hypothetical protein
VPTVMFCDLGEDGVGQRDVHGVVLRRGVMDSAIVSRERGERWVRGFLSMDGWFRLRAKNIFPNRYTRVSNEGGLRGNGRLTYTPAVKPWSAILGLRLDVIQPSKISEPGVKNLLVAILARGYCQEIWS